jgi:2-keto-4-pentenoate hydratase/2-oxohepta-3-ene-1,7-dioic acid hydratase in catechol pathway
MQFGTMDGELVLVRDDRALNVARGSRGRLPADPLAALACWDEVLRWASGAEFEDATPVERLGAIVPCPRQVFAVGLNYRPHAQEAGFEVPAAPLVFTKFPSCISGPDTVVVLPPGAVDWEVEIVAVIGAGGRRIAPERGWDVVAALTLGQDLSERRLQLAGKPAQFSLGKSYAGFGPIGPVAVTPDSFADRDDIGFECLLNGEQMQRARTSEMIFDVPHLIASISDVCELYPGDLVFTGTPAGVGNRRTPPRYLRPGDTLVSRAEGIGEIRQQFRLPAGEEAARAAPVH